MKVTVLGIRFKGAVFIPLGKYVWDSICGKVFREVEGVTVGCGADAVFSDITDISAAIVDNVLDGGVMVSVP